MKNYTQPVLSTFFACIESSKKLLLKKTRLILLSLTFLLPFLLHGNTAKAQIVANFSDYSTGCESVCFYDYSYDYSMSDTGYYTYYGYDSTSYCTINAWYWNFGDGSSSTLQNPCHTFPDTGVYNVTLTVSDTCGNIDSITYSVYSGSSITAGIVYFSSYVICSSSTDAAYSSGDPGGVWSTSDASVATVDSSGTVTGISSGSAAITYTISDICGTSSASATITVTDTATAGTISGGANVCLGSYLYLIDYTGTGTGSWSNSGTAVVSMDSVGDYNYLVGTSAGTSVITYSVTSSCGTASVSDTIIVFPVPLVTVTPASDTTLCSGSCLTLSASASEAVSYSWSPAYYGTISCLTCDTTTVCPTWTTNYTVYVTDSNGCSNYATTGIVYVSSSAGAGAVYFSSYVICDSSTTTAYSSGDPGGTWSTSDPSVATVDSLGNVTGISPGSALITYTITASCGLSSASATITVTDTAAAGAISGGVNACVGSYISLSDYTGMGTGAWSSSDTMVAVIYPYGDYSYVYYIGAGSAVITYSITGSCGAASTSDTITVYPLPSVTVTPSHDTTVCPGACLSLSASASEAVSYSWYPSYYGGFSCSTCDTATACPSYTTNYAVTVTDSNGCSNTGYTGYVYVTSGVSAGVVYLSSSVICGGSTDSAYSSGDPGGTWSSSDPSVATVDSSGTIIGISPGSALITYTISLSCGSSSASASVIITDTATAGTISGGANVCLGSYLYLSDFTAIGTGTWSSSDTTVATAYSYGDYGYVASIGAGTAIITYSVTSSCGTASVADTITVYPLPVVTVTPSTDTTLCSGSCITLSASASGAASYWWYGDYSYELSCDTCSTVVACPPSSTYYEVYVTDSNGCSNYASTGVINVAIPATVTFSAYYVLIGATVTASSYPYVPGGVWSSSDASIATVDSSGVVTGISLGEATITYLVSDSCGTLSSSATITVLDSADLSGSATMIGADIFMQASHLELGIGYLGAYGTNSAPPIYYHPTNSDLGMVADPDEDGWSVGTPSYFGDYFLPGDPVEGWCIQANGTRNDAYYQNYGFTSNYGSGGLTLSGSNISVTKNGAMMTACWQGTAYSGLSITQITSLDTNQMFWVTTVILKNTTSATISDIYYMRECDPDNEEPWTGNFTTNNTIVNQGPDTFLVSATGTAYPTRSYLGLGTTYPNSKVFFCDYSLLPSESEGLDAIYNGTASDVSYSGSLTQDVGIGVVIHADDLAPGASESFKFSYAAQTGAFGSALTAMTGAGWSVDGTTLAGSVDTVATSVYAADTTYVNILNTGDYLSWNWSPSTGLADTSGPTNTIYPPAATITYTITGTPACGLSEQTYYLTIVPDSTLSVHNAGGQNDVISIYPNPAQTTVHIDAHEKVNVRVTSVDGKLLQVLNNTKDIDISGFADGVYLIELYNMQGVKVKTARIVKVE